MGEKLTFLFINGRGSSGKDTQADLLIQKLPLAKRISTGDIIRGAKDPGSEFAQYEAVLSPFLKDTDKGIFVPDEVMVSVVEDVVSQERQKGVATFIFTGFPRTIEQYHKSLNWLEEGDLKHIVLAVGEDISRERAKIRREKALAQGLQVRPDDMEEVLANRLYFYNGKTEPMIRQVLKEGKCGVLLIRANRPIDEIHEKVLKSLKIA